MSRSRRKRKPGKCICGRGYVPYADHVHHRRVPVADCPVLQPVHEWNDRFRKFKRRREDAVTGKIDDEAMSPPIDHFREMAADAYAARALFRGP